MRSYEHKTGFTLVEMIIVVAIIALLATMVIGIAARIDSQGKGRLMRETFDLLDAALEAFADYGYAYVHSDYEGLRFPLDCNDFRKLEFERTLGDALGVLVSADPYDRSYSGSTALCFFLNKVPTCRKTLDKIHRPDKGGIVKPLITNKDAQGNDLQISVDGRTESLVIVMT
jgi:prepilin-type N-terminal cleavage/methylation domain-containing protein